jgi:hypothetical protein
MPPFEILLNRSAHIVLIHENQRDLRPVTGKPVLPGFQAGGGDFERERLSVRGEPVGESMFAVDQVRVVGVMPEREAGPFGGAAGQDVVAVAADGERGDQFTDTGEILLDEIGDGRDEIRLARLEWLELAFVLYDDRLIGSGQVTLSPAATGWWTPAGWRNRIR